MLSYRLLRTVGMGAGSVLLVTVVLPIVARAAKPVMKSAIMGGLSLKDQMKEAYAENREKFDDLVAEVKEEETGKARKSKRTKKK
ncbi:MAG: hypothetical protein MAG551_02159 [Candidatus Scalindua arabica]|uniref:DUF5132 domain-containing protein n=1 Tax=Candidatus Scalindua arabica TaxID=1127984 RepID=A0A942A1E3_9BACT|nr:hypothetical protein [Candidatus Scalindua arabica]